MASYTDDTSSWRSGWHRRVMIIDKELHMECPPASVFDLMADVLNVTRRNDSVLLAELTSDEAIRQGSQPTSVTSPAFATRLGSSKTTASGQCSVSWCPLKGAPNSGSMLCLGNTIIPVRRHFPRQSHPHTHHQSVDPGKACGRSKRQRSLSIGNTSMHLSSGAIMLGLFSDGRRGRVATTKRGQRTRCSSCPCL